MKSIIRVFAGAACILALLLAGCTPCCVGVAPYAYSTSYTTGYVYTVPVVYATPRYGIYDISNPGHTGYSYNTRYLYNSGVYSPDWGWPWHD